MITLLRMFRLWQLRTKWKLAFWQYVDKTAKEIQKDPELLAKKVMPELAKIIHEQAQSQKKETEV